MRNSNRNEGFMKKYYKDIILIIMLIIISIWIFVGYSFFAKNGTNVRIYVDKELYVELDLSVNQTKKITTEYGTNIIRIKDNKVNVQSASCDNQICVNHKAISNAKESIVCIPNRLVVTIEENVDESDNKAGDIDDIAK